jgi:hypothetical protein
MSKKLCLATSKPKSTFLADRTRAVEEVKFQNSLLALSAAIEAAGTVPRASGFQTAAGEARSVIARNLSFDTDEDRKIG